MAAREERVEGSKVAGGDKWRLVPGRGLCLDDCVYFKIFEKKFGREQ